MVKGGGEFPLGIKPLVFVAMPFGRKQDTSGTIEIDFDDIYRRGIIPATEDADVDVIRADEERMGGFIHASMYERLLLAEIVIADLTLANPNVFYELGIRHAARPRATIMIFNEGGMLPFDVRPLRAIPYCLNEDGRLSDEEAERLRKTLTAKLREAQDDDLSDSPLFQLIPSFPGIRLPHEVTESFRDRIRYIDAKRMEIERARDSGNRERGLDELAKIQRELEPFNTAPPELLVDLLLAYRDLSSWDNMVRLVEQLPPSLKEHRTIQEQYSLALNRRNAPGDRQLAIRVLKSVIDVHGQNPETCGILGRVYKDMYSEAKASGRLGEAEGYLGEAIQWYKEGFEADPRDYYPGINAAMLLFEKGDQEALKELEQLIPVVEFAVARRGGINSRDYWDVATVLHLAILGQKWSLARRAAHRFSATVTHAWIVETTLADLRRIEETMARLSKNTAPLREIILELTELKGRLT